MRELTAEERNKAEEMIRTQAVEGRIQCGKARAIAKKLGVPLKLVGALTDDLNIRISQCELGCF